MKKSLSIQAANGLFLLTMALVLVLGSVMQMLSLTLGLIGTELLLILLPALLFLRARGIPLREGLRLRGLPAVWVPVFVLLGTGTWMFTIWIEAQMLILSGLPSVALPDSMLPKDAAQMVLYFVALAIAAPLCEEALFRGAIQGAYEHHREAKFAILLSGLMFAFYHFRLTGLPALLPVAFILGYVVWRSQSLLAGVLVHFGMNAASAAYTIYALSTGEPAFALVTPWINLGGLVTAAACLVLVITRMPRPVTEGGEEMGLAPAAAAPRGEAAPALLPPRPGWLRSYWPLVVAFPLYLLVAGLTMLPVLFPEMTAENGVSFTAPQGQVPAQTSRYTVLNRAGEVVGSAECSVEPGGERIHLQCRREVQAYQVQVGNSFFSESASTQEWTAEWDAKTLALLSYSSETRPDGAQPYQFTLEGGELASESGSASLPEGSMVELEWPWRAGHLSTQAGVSYKVPFAWLSRWDEAQQKSLPGAKEYLLRMYPLENIRVPAGSFQAWKISIGGEESAWYSGLASQLVQYDDGMVLYQLEK